MRLGYRIPLNELSITETLAINIPYSGNFGRGKLGNLL